MPDKEEKPANTHGIYIALLPDYGFDLSLVGLDIHLINGLECDIEYVYDLEMSGQITESYEGDIPAGDLLHMDHFYFAQLNENPAITVSATFIDNGRQRKIEKTVKPKPKVIHNGPKFSPLLNEEAFVYEVYIHKEPIIAPQAKPTTPKQKLDIEMLKHLMMEKTTSKDSFDLSVPTYELDLHFDALVANESKYQDAEKLHVQLETFRQKLDSAIANGLHSMVVIHGVGSGRLKEEVCKILKEHPKVRSFKPPLHRRYGFGATEIFF